MYCLMRQQGSAVLHQHCQWYWGDSTKQSNAESIPCLCIASFITSPNTRRVCVPTRISISISKYPPPVSWTNGLHGITRMAGTWVFWPAVRLVYILTTQACTLHRCTLLGFLRHSIPCDLVCCCCCCHTGTCGLCRAVMPGCVQGVLCTSRWTNVSCTPRTTPRRSCQGKLIDQADTGVQLCAAITLEGVL